MSGRTGLFLALLVAAGWGSGCSSRPPAALPLVGPASVIVPAAVVAGPLAPQERTVLQGELVAALERADYRLLVVPRLTGVGPFRLHRLARGLSRVVADLPQLRLLQVEVVALEPDGVMPWGLIGFGLGRPWFEARLQLVGPAAGAAGSDPPVILRRSSWQRQRPALIRELAGAVVARLAGEEP